MWVLIVICFVLAFLVAVAAQLSVFNLKVTQLITFRRVKEGSS